jgi:hypothetical protein
MIFQCFSFKKNVQGPNRTTLHFFGIVGGGNPYKQGYQHRGKLQPQAFPNACQRIEVAPGHVGLRRSHIRLRATP